MSKPRFVFVLRTFGVLIALWWSSCIVGAYRTTDFGFAMGVVWAQLLMSVIFTVPLCMAVSAGLPWFQKFAIIGIVIFVGVLFSHVHAAVQEAAVLRQFGQHPTTRVVVHRWFPYRDTTVSFEPQIGMWIGYD